MSEQEPQELSFEDALSKLEQIVEELDTGRLPLEQAIARFREGAALKAFCERKLVEAQAVIEEYLEQAAPGETRPDAGAAKDGQVEGAKG